ncbi:MAG: methyltransferase [Ruminococcaceae bacterium]|nr:methyltransferase [Oscillospiraceae bacterium]
MEVRQDEILYEVNDGIRIIQKKDSLLFGTDALFLAAYVRKTKGIAYEFGGGSGVISLLCAQRGKFKKARIFEVQLELHDVIERNIELNGFSDILSSHNMDVRDIKGAFGEEYADVVFSNPPYMTPDSGKRNENKMKYISRHEVCGDIKDFCRAASDALKFGGAFYCVYREDRLVDLLCAMRENGLEPKRMTFVCADEKCKASMVLVEAKKGASSSLFLTEPLIIKRNGEIGEEARYIYENGEFCEKYRKR